MGKAIILELVVFLILTGIADTAWAQTRESKKDNWSGLARLGAVYIDDTNNLNSAWATSLGGGIVHKWFAASFRAEFAKDVFNIGSQYEVGLEFFRVGVGSFFEFSRRERNIQFLSMTSTVKGFYINARYGNTIAGITDSPYKDLSFGKEFKW